MNISPLASAILVSLALSSLCIAPTALAQSSPPGKPTEAASVLTLDRLRVHGESPAHANVIEKDAEALSEARVADERDLLRHETGVGVVEGGRSGSNGYSIRGVEGDRVSITVDGLSQADSYIPEVYSGYGYLNGNRNTTELENIGSVRIEKGADSFRTGSGALGGSVRFFSKSAEDFVQPGQPFGLLAKTGYSGKNREWRFVLGGGVVSGGFRGALQFTRRHGHELKAYGDGLDVEGAERGLADPVERESHSILAKAGYRFGAAHLLEASFENRALDIATHERSYTDVFGERRLSLDTSPYRRRQLRYAWTPESSWLKEFTAAYGGQWIEQHAITRNHEARDPRRRITQKYDRKFTQTLDQLELRLDSQTIRAGQWRHQWQAAAGASHGYFENINLDTLYGYSGAGSADIKRYRIADPVRTRAAFLALQDRIEWGDATSLGLGARHDRYRHQPEPDGANQNRTTYSPEPRQFSATTGFAHLRHDLGPHFSVGYKAATGFRAPRAQELYFQFQRGQNYIVPNPELRAEHAFNQEIEFNLHGEAGHAALSIHHTRYRNFIEERHSQSRQPNPYYDPAKCRLYPLRDLCDPYLVAERFQNVNIDSATVRGVEFDGGLDLRRTIGLPEGSRALLRFTHTRGRTGIGDGLRAIQPFTAVLGLAYARPDDRWRTQLTLRHVAAKRERDTIRTEFGWRGEVRRAAPYLSRAYSVVDMEAGFRLGAHWRLDLGVDNLLNRKYSTWDSLRSIPSFGSTNMVDRRGYGLERFTAPGRHYSMVLQGRF
ncbi:TonB-dependent hemoglobin/transferrin/lactoferrin family receptor [Solilutibacter pythonis]|nr:TonB-dependent hemoglobin/transferrin/lactoferrin family receptor [Lysobacter pythonis]